MSYLKSIGTSIIYIGTFLAVITFIPGIPPDAKFAEYSIMEPKGLNNFNINERLNNAEILFQGQVKGPEDFTSYNGELFTGLHGGYVVKVTEHKLIPIVKFGQECDGLWQESKCGRPLGLTFDKTGTLYVADAYYGIYKVDIKTGKYERLVNNKEAIEGKVPKVFNSLAVASNGDIYWSDSSTEFAIEDGVFAVLANPSARLIRYNAATKKNQVLIHNLSFANGVILSEDETFVLVAETVASRITKYIIKGSQAGKREIFVEGLPGCPDNIKTDNNNGFLVSLVTYSDEENPQIFQSLIPHPHIRRMFTRLLAILEVPLKFLQSYYPNYYSERIIHYVGHFESLTFLYSPKVLILRIDNKGNILDALYGTDNNISGVSTAYIHDKYLWLGSPFAEYIARISLNKVFPNLDVQRKTLHSTNNKSGINHIPKEEKTSAKTVSETSSSTSTTTTTTTETPRFASSNTPKPDAKVYSNEKKPTQNHKNSLKN